MTEKESFRFVMNKNIFGNISVSIVRKPRHLQNIILVIAQVYQLILAKSQCGQM